MKEIRHFVPGATDQVESPLARLRKPIPPGVAEAYVHAYTQPGDTVLVPYCQGPVAIRAILLAERRAMAINFDPVLVLITETALSPPPTRQLDAAVARLGDSRKQGIPLRQYLEGLYTTACPACQRPAVAEYFVWDRDQGQPIAKQMQCPECAWQGRSAIDAEDLARMAEIPRRGMHYHYVLERVAAHPQPGIPPSRLESLLALYTPRNLYALAELTLRIDGQIPEGPVRRALLAILLDCLDRCSSLTPLPSGSGHRRTLSRPSRFLEHNVWQAFIRTVSHMPDAESRPLANLAESQRAFQAADGGSASYVGHGLVRDLPREVPPRSISLILASPPSLNAAAWTLSYFWGAWLFGNDAVTALRPLLRQRTPDPAWYSEVMARSFRNLASLLRDEGRMVLILTGQRPAVLEALTLAAASSQLGVTSLVQNAGDYRLHLTPSLAQPAPALPGPLSYLVQAATQRAAIEAIQTRGEPVPWRTLHAAISFRLVRDGLMAAAIHEDAESTPLAQLEHAVQAALEDPAFVELSPPGTSEHLWWLAKPAGIAEPLSDRVEQTAYELLEQSLALTEYDFSCALQARFPGGLTPADGLVAACLQAYGYEATPGYWQLRPEDRAQDREAERQTIVEHLRLLGKRLGYRAAPFDPFDAGWFEAEIPRAAFVVRWQAAVDEALALSDQLRGARPYLVIPGGRSALVSHKLAHNPLWQQAVDASDWRFIKYRHVRQLAAKPDLDQYALQTIVGLDPIVEQEAAQLSLF